MACALDEVVGVDTELPRREGDQTLDRIGGSLITGRERPEIVDRVAPEIDPNRLVALRREDIHDSAPNGDLPARFDTVGSLVPHAGERSHQIGDLDLVATRDDDRCRIARRRPLHDCANRRHNHGSGVGPDQPMTRLGSTSHRRCVRRDVLEGENLPCRHEDHVVGEEPEIVGQFLGVTLPRHHHQKRVPELAGKTGDSECPRTGGYHPPAGERREVLGAPAFEEGRERCRHATEIVGTPRRDASSDQSAADRMTFSFRSASKPSRPRVNPTISRAPTR